MYELGISLELIDDSTGAASLWMESTSTTAISETYPAEVSHMLTPRVKALLTANGHTAREFAPYLARVIGPAAVAPPRGARRNHRKLREAFMIPYTELRRLLTDARAAGTPFSVTFRQRRGAHWRRVRYTQRSNGSSTCQVLGLRALIATCTDEERRLLATPPPEWAMRLLLFFPFPMRLSDAMGPVATPELGCMC